MPENPDARWQWNRLLDHVEHYRVVPVVGRELLHTEIDGQVQHVPTYLAKRIADYCGLDWSPDPTADPISSVVQHYLTLHRDDVTWPYTYLHKLVRELDRTPVPPALKKLAGIPFPLFISTTPDRYLERALNEVRGPADEAKVLPYCLGSAVDLTVGGTSVVFPLLGVASSSPDYAITDEDVLEFVHRFQTTGAPRRLLDALRKSHLLIIGGGFSDWLTRFLMRLAKPERLWTSTRQLTFVADYTVSADSRLLSFLKHPMSNTHVFPVSSAEAFVSELCQRWHERHPTAWPASPIVSPAPQPSRVTAGVFISYAHEDRAAAERVRDALQNANIDVWFDERNLESGDAYRREIAEQIKRSSLFVAVISRHALDPEFRFFKYEWREAEECAKEAPFNHPFIQPIVIDDTPATAAELPAFIREVHWTKAPGGDVPHAFVSHVVEHYRNIQRQTSHT